VDQLAVSLRKADPWDLKSHATSHSAR
jgi:hypothetical protein